MKRMHLRYVWVMVLIVAFVCGFMMVLKGSLSWREGVDGDGDGGSCPDLLLKRGNKYVLIHSKTSETEGQTFDTLEAYQEYQKQHQECPALIVQEEGDVQGQDVYRIYASADDMGHGGLHRWPINAPSNAPVFPAPFTLKDNDYPGFDPFGLNVGRFTDVDKVHEATATATPISENPMDPNWGGIPVTATAVDQGKYDQNQVTRLPPMPTIGSTGWGPT